MTTEIIEILVSCAISIIPNETTCNYGRNGVNASAFCPFLSDSVTGRARSTLGDTLPRTRLPVSFTIKLLGISDCPCFLECQLLCVKCIVVPYWEQSPESVFTMLNA